MPTNSAYPDHHLTVVDRRHVRNRFSGQQRGRFTVFQQPSRAAADGRQDYYRSISRPADRETGEFYFGTNGESSAGIDTFSELLGWLAGRLYPSARRTIIQEDARDQRVVFGAVDVFGLPDELAPDRCAPEAPMLEPAPPWLVLRALNVCWSTTPV